MKTPEQLTVEAERLRVRAEELDTDVPMAAEYNRTRADWCDYLARQRSEERRLEGGAP